MTRPQTRPQTRLAALAAGAVASAVIAISLAACDPTLPLQVLSEQQQLSAIDATPDSTNLRVGDSVRVVVKFIGKGGGAISPLRRQPSPWETRSS